MTDITNGKSSSIAEIILNEFSLMGSKCKSEVVTLIKNGINCGRYYRHIAADICLKINITPFTKNIRKITKILRNEFPEGER